MYSRPLSGGASPSDCCGVGLGSVEGAFFLFSLGVADASDLGVFFAPRCRKGVWSLGRRDCQKVIGCSGGRVFEDDGRMRVITELQILVRSVLLQEYSIVVVSLLATVQYSSRVCLFVCSYFVHAVYHYTGVFLNSQETSRVCSMVRRLYGSPFYRARSQRSRCSHANTLLGAWRDAPLLCMTVVLRCYFVLYR